MTPMTNRGPELRSGKILRNINERARSNPGPGAQKTSNERAKPTSDSEGQQRPEKEMQRQGQCSDEQSGQIREPEVPERGQTSASETTETESHLEEWPTDGIGGLSGRAWSHGTTAADRKRAAQPFPNYAGDPEPLGPEASKRDHQAHLKILRDYSSQMMAAYNKTTMRGIHLWLDFIVSFRPHTVRSWSKPMLHEWTDLLMKRGIHVTMDRKRSPHEAVIDIMYWEDYMPSGQQAATPDRSQVQDIRMPEPTRQGHDQKQQMEHDDNAEGTKGAPVKAVRDNPDGDDPGTSSSSSSDDETDSDRGAEHKRKRQHVVKGEGDENNKGIRPEAEDASNSTERDKAPGITGMVRAFAGQTKFSGRYEEDLDDTIETFETYATMCDLTESQKRKAMPIMLTGNALSLFNNKVDLTSSYGEALSLLRTWYNSREKQTRLLREWQGMRLSAAMQKDPEQSEIGVYRTFVAKLMSTQKQLDKSYHGDRYLRDQLLTSIDIPSVQDALKDRVPRGAQQLVNRVANRLSDTPRSAGQTSAYIGELAKQQAVDQRPTSMANYTLGQTYGGEAKRQTKQFGPKPRRYNTGATRRLVRTRRRPFPKWLKGVKGCMVCGKEGHIASQKHSEPEVKEAIRKLKEKQYKAMLTEEDLSYVAELFSVEEVNYETEPEPEDDFDEEDEDSDLAYVAEEQLTDLRTRMADFSFLHGRDIHRERTELLSAMHVGLSIKGQKQEFDGVKIDTGANRRSIMSENQYSAYCKLFGLCPAVKPHTHGVSGIGGSTRSKGRVTIQVPFPNLFLVIDVEFLLMEGAVPSLLSMRDMLTNGLDISLQRRVITFRGRAQKLELDNFFLVYKWKPSDISYALYTETDLRRLHRAFGHPSTETTRKLLKRAQGGSLDTKTNETIRQIAEACKVCRMNRSKPRRFKLTIGTGGLEFNSRVQIDTMFLRGRPVIHMVDQATHFCAAAFLRNQTSREVWRAIQGLWNMVYLGPPDYLMVDQGSNYVSKELKGELQANGVKLDEAPIESPGTIGTVERYHAPLRAAFEKIRQDVDSVTSDAECLKMAVFAVNATVGPEGLCPILLVFGAMPRPARAGPTQTQVQRATAIDNAMREVEKEQARRRISFGLKHGGGPKAIESSAKLRELPAGSPIIVYRQQSNRWEGPFTFISIQGETVVIQTPRGRKIFRSNCIRPWVKAEWDRAETGQEAQQEHDDTSRAYLAEEDGEKEGKSKMKEKERSVQYSESRKEELKGLVTNGTFLPMHRSKVPEEARVFGSRFIDEVKKAGTGLRKKSRLIAQNYNDDGASYIATKAPTIKRYSQRLALSLAASMSNMTAFTRDVTQAYVQSTSNLERDVYIKAPKELGLEEGTVLKVVRPLYGIPESGLHWYLTYLEHHLETLRMTRTKADACMLVRKNEGELDGAVLLQVDDSLSIGTETFMRDEEMASRKFISKPRAVISKPPTPFNGVLISRDEEGTLLMNQTQKVEKLTRTGSQAEFNSLRALGQYIGVCTRPDVCANIQLIAPGSSNTTAAEQRTLERTISHMARTKETGLTYQRLDMDTMRLVLVTDASFANARNLRSQLGFVILMSDASGKANIVHYGSSRCKRVTRSILAAEVHALVLGYDHAFVVRDLLEEMIGRKVGLEAYVDSRSVFDVIAKDGNTTEKRLQIDICALRESYANGELDKIGWIPGNLNPADALTKIGTCASTALMRLMKSNEWRVKPLGWASVRRHGIASEKRKGPVSNHIDDNRRSLAKASPAAGETGERPEEA